MADQRFKGEMIRGHIDTVILLILTDGDKDSNEIRASIEEKSDNTYSVKQGTFYSAMQRLVKQGYIKEYRSSATTGIRRKYYSLNPKGKQFLEKNREQWEASKNLVDNLMDNETTPPVKEPITDDSPVKDEFEEFKEIAKDIGDFTVEEPINDNSYFDKLGDDVLNELNAELEKLNQNEESQDSSLAVEETVVDEQIAEQAVETPQVDDYESISNKTVTDLYDFETIEEESDFIDQSLLEDGSETEVIDDAPAVTETVEETVVEPIITETVQPTVVEEKAEKDSVVISEKPEKTPIFTNEKDDLLIVEEGKPTNRREYKQILNKLFPQTEEKPNAKVEEPRQNERQKEFVSYSETYNGKREEKVEEKKVNQTPPPVEEEPTKKQVKPVTADPSDFSDLYQMASREGFKIKTSHNTNRYTGNEILINKLRLHSSLLFYLFIAVECLILNFALSNLLGWSVPVKLIILGSLALYPLVTIVTYVLNKKRSVYEISPFKDAISVALIVTFQLAIIILCVALFVSVDFNNFKEVTTFILLPLILAINIPLYFILKYSLLSTGKYFTE